MAFTGPAEDQFGAAIDDRVSRMEMQSTANSGKKSIPNSRIRRGTITASNGDGTYIVKVVGADSTTERFALDGVRPWDITVTFAVGQSVTLLYEGARPVPWIMSAGGTSGEVGTTTILVGYVRFFS